MAYERWSQIENDFVKRFVKGEIDEDQVIKKIKKQTGRTRTRQAVLNQAWRMKHKQHNTEKEADYVLEQKVRWGSQKSCESLQKVVEDDNLEELFETVKAGVKIQDFLWENSDNPLTEDSSLVDWQQAIESKKRFMIYQIDRQNSNWKTELKSILLEHVCVCTSLLKRL